MLAMSAALGLALTGPALAQTATAARDGKTATSQKAVTTSRLDARPTRANLTSYRVSAKQPVYIYQAPKAVKPLKTW